MGQKVNPYGFRLGITTTWKATWFFDRGFKDYLVEDLRLRKLIRGYCKRQRISGVSSIETRRKIPAEVWVTVQTARPGLLIGRQGRGIETLRRELEQATGKQVHINVEEVKDFRLDARLIAEGIAEQIERRRVVARVIKRAVEEGMKAGAKGIKVKCSGRLGGAEIARTASAKEGKIPLSTLRADIDYGVTEARTAYGNIGVKVWVCRDDGRGLASLVARLPLNVERSALLAAAAGAPSESREVVAAPVEVRLEGSEGFASLEQQTAGGQT